MNILTLSQFEKIENRRKNAKDCILKEEEKIENTLKKLKDNGKISEKLFEDLKPMGSQPPRIYGLAKVHKNNITVRPVLSMPGSPYHKISQKITEWLSVIPESKINCSSKQTMENIKNTRLENNEVIISFDITSLYTNVPVKEAITEATNKLYSGELNKPPVDRKTFTILIELAMCNILMLTHDGYYRQTDGLAMGSPPAPLLANIWLSKFEPVINNDAKVFQRYMDDILISINKDGIHEKLNEINNLHSNLKFTIEVEKEGKLPFLDLQIIHESNELKSTWYNKPTDTGLVMNFFALAPRSYKRSVVQGFVHRVFRACSSWSLFHESLEAAKTILEKNQYPPDFYEPIIKETLEKLVNRTNETNNEVPNNKEKEKVSEKHMMFLQYRGAITGKYIKKLKEKGVSVQPVITLQKIKYVLPSLKPSIGKDIKSRVVYKVTCPGCQTCYVGQTSRHLRTRLAEHKNRKDQPVRIHFDECVSDVPTLKDVDILHSTFRNLTYLLTLEA